MQLTAKTIERSALLVIGALCAWPVVTFSMTHYLPLVDNDEVVYFLQVKTFLAHGFHGGHFFLNDQVPASRIRFGLHGPAFITIYGLLASVIGWRNESPYIANLLVSAAAFGLLWTALRAEPRRRSVIAIFILLHAYFFLFLPSLMQESFHLAIAIALAALWYMSRTTGSTSATVALFGVTAVAMLMRFTWGLVLPIFVFSTARTAQGGWRWPGSGLVWAAFAVMIGGGATYLAMKLWQFWTAPTTIDAGILPGFSREALPNLRTYFSFRTNGAFERYPIYARVSLWAWTTGLIVCGIRTREPRTRDAALESAALLLIATAAQILFYLVDGWRDFRVLASFHALAAIAFLARVHVPFNSWRRPTQIAVVTSVIVCGLINYALAWEGVASRYRVEWQRAEGPEADRAARQQFAAMAAHLEISRDAGGYCKTLYGPIDVVNDPLIMHLPGGFAFSMVVPSPPGQLPLLRGKYALLHNVEYPMRMLFDNSPNWRLEGVFDRFVLYRSTVNCFS